MKDIIIDSFLSVRRKLNPNQRRNVFELFGFDFLIDEEFRFWLLEVNTNPYLGTPNDDMRKLVPNMMEHLCQLVVDPITVPDKVPTEAGPNLFELIYREENVWTGTPSVNHRQSFSLDLCYPISELRPFIGKMSTAKNKKSYKYKLFLQQTSNANKADIKPIL